MSSEGVERSREGKAGQQQQHRDTHTNGPLRVCSGQAPRHGFAEMEREGRRRERELVDKGDRDARARVTEKKENFPQNPTIDENQASDRERDERDREKERKRERLL